MIRFTEDAGIGKLAESEGKTLVLTFTTVINESAEAVDKIVYEEKSAADNRNEALIPNQAKVTIGGISNLTEIPYVYTGKIEIRKVSPDGTPLAGAEFTLYREDGSEFIRDGSAYEVTTEADGTAVFKGLANGTYLAKETKAPAGKELLTDPITIRIENGIVSVVNGQKVNPEKRIITVTDQGKIILKAGGPGTGNYHILGILAILGASAVLMGQRRKRQP